MSCGDVPAFQCCGEDNDEADIASAGIYGLGPDNTGTGNPGVAVGYSDPHCFDYQLERTGADNICLTQQDPDVQGAQWYSNPGLAKRKVTNETTAPSTESNSTAPNTNTQPNKHPPPRGWQRPDSFGFKIWNDPGPRLYLVRPFERVPMYREAIAAGKNRVQAFKVVKGYFEAIPDAEKETWVLRHGGFLIKDENGKEYNPPHFSKEELERLKHEG
ncbi:hypothetical protein HDV00_007267 [Rhizophlyctis rosea]|nr:hypothetical protein HDV00_007267 [Rhizophlyctis rosea]